MKEKYKYIKIVLWRYKGTVFLLFFVLIFLYSMSRVSGVNTLQVNKKTCSTAKASAYAKNNIGKILDEEMVCHTGKQKNGVIIDSRDEQEYDWVRIGTQIWFAKNLNASVYNDGTGIDLLPLPKNLESDYRLAELWDLYKQGARCYYENNENSVYGALYNIHAVYSEKLCPVGWHVATENDWENLFLTLGGQPEWMFEGGDSLGPNAQVLKDIAGKLKDTTDYYWEAPNYCASDEWGFNALPGGQIMGNDIPTFEGQGMISSWWKITEDEFKFKSWDIENNSCDITEPVDWVVTGAYVRCVKDG
ncbi:MAG: fibrobacter succinogenes major paralogous domain-containing protein [Bacteroidales bacterium]|nr:fibrobacter succinogenes major paralogous domain-containing protein [Bacteroidales bacterium]